MNNLEAYLLKKENCPICSGKSKIIDKCKSMNPDSDLVFNLRECAICKQWWTDPAVTQECLNDFYKNSSPFVVPSYYPKAMLNDKSDLVAEKKIYESICPYSEKMKENSGFNYLEIGIGSGHLFQYFKQKSKTSYGVEPGEWVIKKDENILKDIDLIPSNMKFDVIIAHDVLEHLSDPPQMIKKLKVLANQGCVVYSTFPNKDSWKAKLLKSKWSMIRPFGHMNYFSKKSIRHMFEKNGFEIIKIKSMRAGYTKPGKIIKTFDYKSKNLMYRLLKSLLLGQLILGKDQWQVIARSRQ